MHLDTKITLSYTLLFNRQMGHTGCNIFSTIIPAVWYLKQFLDVLEAKKKKKQIKTNQIIFNTSLPEHCRIQPTKLGDNYQTV